MTKLSLIAAAALAAPAAAGKPVESISYETSPCFGACPIYKVTVRSDGTGLFEGRRFTGVVGSRTFRVAPAQYRAFTAHLQPARPAPGIHRAEPKCRQMATDHPSATVVWTARDGGQQQLNFYFGCFDPEYRSLAKRLAAAPDLLPIRAFIERKPPTLSR